MLVKNPNRETQNRAVAQPLVVGRTATVFPELPGGLSSSTRGWEISLTIPALMFVGGIFIAPAFAQTVTLASEDGWIASFASIDWVGAAKTFVYFLLTLGGLAALGFAVWMGIHYVGDAFQKASSHIRQQNEGTRIKTIQDSVIQENQSLEALVQKARLAVNDADVLAEQRLQMFLTNTHSAVDQMKADLERMKYYPGILPKFNQSELWFWVVVVGLLLEFVIECFVNVVLLGASASWLDAGAMAVFFAALNIIVGFLAGRVIKWMWQKIGHAAAFSAGAVMTGIGLYIAAIFGKFRDIFVYGRKDAPSGNFDAATEILTGEIWPPSLSAFNYGNITSYQPFIVAVVFFILAIMGAWKIYDPYSEMRRVERRLQGIYGRREKMLKERVDHLKAGLRKWPDDIADSIQQQERKIAGGQGQLGKFDPQGPNIKAAQVADELLSEARKRLTQLRENTAELEPAVAKAVGAVDAHGKKTHAELVKIHKDIADFTTPRQGARRRNSPIDESEMKEPTL